MKRKRVANKSVPCQDPEHHHILLKQRRLLDHGHDHEHGHHGCALQNCTSVGEHVKIQEPRSHSSLKDCIVD